METNRHPPEIGRNSPATDRPMRLTRRDLLTWLACGAAASLQTGCRPARPLPPPAQVAMSEVHYLSLTDVAALIKSRRLSPVALTRTMLDRIQALDGHLHSYARVMADSALAAASAAEREIQSGHYRGPLHGMPIAVKDLCYTQGVPTMGGMKLLQDFVPDYDATVVARLEAAGAILLGKLSLTEGAMVGYHRDFPMPLNPWGEELWAGVSSSGSGVATAAGLCFASIGTDTGGSIRFPSMANGTVGLKPTYGRVSRYGVLPLAESLDHIGPMTRSVADAAIMLEAIAGYDPNDPTSLRAPAAGAPFAVAPGLQYGSMSEWNQARRERDLALGLNKPITSFTFPHDLAGTPALALPCGVSGQGLPYTMQLAGSALSEAMLCRIGHAYEQSTPWHQRHPPV